LVDLHNNQFRNINPIETSIAKIPSLKDPSSMPNNPTSRNRSPRILQLTNENIRRLDKNMDGANFMS
jgi:hypothetical protein